MLPLLQSSSIDHVKTIIWTILIVFYFLATELCHPIQPIPRPLLRIRLHCRCADLHGTALCNFQLCQIWSRVFQLDFKSNFWHNCKGYAFNCAFLRQFSGFLLAFIRWAFSALAFYRQCRKVIIWCAVCGKVRLIRWRRIGICFSRFCFTGTFNAILLSNNSSVFCLVLYVVLGVHKFLMIKI